MKFGVSEGFVSRKPDGRICAQILFSGMTHNSTKAMQAWGIERLEFISSAERISSDENLPTVFEVEKAIEVAKGSELFPMFGSPTKAEVPMEVKMLIVAHLFEKNGKIVGVSTTYCNLSFYNPIAGKMLFTFDYGGPFELVVGDLV